MENEQKKLTINEFLMLLVLLLFAFFFAFIPHINYPYPVHVDEWHQIAFSKAMLNAGSIDFFEPFYGEWASEINYGVFPGYYLLLGVIQQVCGADIIFMPLYLPGIIFMITVLAVYSYARRKGFGLEAAFFTCLIPTTVGLLGPGFMVPIAAGFLFIPLFLFLIDLQNKIPVYMLCFIFGCFLLLMHPPSAIIMLLIVVPYIVFTMLRNIKRGVLILSVILVPFILTAILAFDIIFGFGEQLFIKQYVPSFVALPDIIQLYGYISIICGLIGIIVLIAKDGVGKYGLIMSLIALLTMLIIFYQFHYGIDVLYLRGLLYTLLIIGIIAGAAMAFLGTINIRRFNIGRYFYAGIFIVILIIAIPARLDIPYYRMMDENDYHAFSWIKDNVTDDNNLAVVDPWKATAFNVVANKKAYQRIFPVQEPMDDMIYNFLDCKCRDTHFLEYNDITVVYSNDVCDNTDLVNVREGVYLFNQGPSQYNVAENLLNNPGMWEVTSDGRPRSWNTWEENIIPHYLYPEPGRNGGYSLGIEISGDTIVDTQFLAGWYQKVPVEEKQTYMLGGWLKTDSIIGNGGARIVAIWHDSTSASIGSSDIMHYITGAHDWNYYEGEVTAPEGATYCIVSCQIVNSTGSTWLDDMLFMEKPVHYQ